jgi:hypothetical protein
VGQELIGLLRSLAPGEWDTQTIAGTWKVRDVAAHLLDTVLRKLSMVRMPAIWNQSRPVRLEM